MSSKFINFSRDHKFILKEWLDMEKLLSTERFQGGYGVDDIDFILDNALKAAREVIAPTNEAADQIGVRSDNGQVITAPGTKDAYFFIQQNGFASSNYNPEDESAVPLCVLWAINEYLVGANPSIATLYLATSGSVGLIEEFGSQELKDMFLEKMYSGEWAGTMDLTEPSAGSDVGDATSKAYPTDTAGVYKIKGTKCFISGGEQDVTENIVHFVLARIDGAAPGTKGLSLFVVPKYRVTSDGGAGQFNDVNCVGIEHKLGLKGSPTCVVAFGENNDCLGYLLGAAPGEDGVGQGMAQMFNMMNEERLMTGHAGLSCAAVAYYNAVEYAGERVQGRATSNPRGGRVPILAHEDIRRMLLFQKAHIEAFRAMVLKSIYLVDMRKFASDPEEAKKAARTIEVNTPIVKAYCSDLAMQCISEALQCYGGYGFSEEYSAAEMFRDARIYPIWEGTNYIQSMDLVGRKMTMAKGAVFAEWLQDIKDFVESNQDNASFSREFAIMKDALQQYGRVQARILKYFTEGPAGMIQFYATRILHATGKLYAARILLDMALLAENKLPGAESHDVPYYEGKMASARFFVRNIVPEVKALADIIEEADRSAIDIDEAAFRI